MSNNNPLIGDVSDGYSGVSFALPKDATVRLSDRERVQRDPDRQTSGEATLGTPPSNTVPSNDKTKQFKPLFFGIDSLYLSYYGQLSEDWDSKLFELKEKAQSEDENVQALAQALSARTCLKSVIEACRAFLMSYPTTAFLSN